MIASRNPLSRRRLLLYNNSPMVVNSRQLVERSLKEYYLQRACLYLRDCENATVPLNYRYYARDDMKYPP
jgi:hypothetical protein